VASFGNTEVKRSLLQIAHLRRRKSRCIAIGKPASVLFGCGTDGGDKIFLWCVCFFFVVFFF
jgi:hypothetical protein